MKYISFKNELYTSSAFICNELARKAAQIHTRLPILNWKKPLNQTDTKNIHNTIENWFLCFHIFSNDYEFFNILFKFTRTVEFSNPNVKQFVKSYPCVQQGWV